MSPFKTQIDLSHAIKEARKHVCRSDLKESLFAFTLEQPLVNLEELKDTVLKIAKDYPMTFVLGSTYVDDKGRVIKKNSGLLNLKGKELDDQIEQEMFAHAKNFIWPIRTIGFIEPGRAQIFNDHHPSLNDLKFAVIDNPFVPPGHEKLFLRGLHAGFHGDFLIASHLLVPQIENSLRYVLESHGIDVSNLDSDGTQSVKTLGPIFDLEEIKNIFGNDLCFELRGCLIEKSAYDFRNKVAHGFVTEVGCHSEASAMIWWHVLRLCLVPFFQVQKMK